MKNKLELWKYRRSLKDFFRNVIDCPEDTDWRKDILDWVVKLYEFHDISIPNFEYLFSRCKDVSFPVQYDSSTPRGVIDSSGNKFYFSYRYNYDGMNVYTIGKKVSSFDICFDFKLLTDTITTCRMYIGQLNADGTKKKHSLVFEYDDTFTKASLKISGTTILTLCYPRQNQNFDTQLANYIFTLVDDNFYDVMRMFLAVGRIIPDVQDLTVSSFDENGEIISEIVAGNGLVEKYIFTIKTNDSFSSLSKLTCSIPIKDFIANPSEALKDLL